MRNRYLPLYQRINRGQTTAVSKDKLINKAHKLFVKLKKKNHIKEEVARLPDKTIRIDLTGSPEQSFIIALEYNKMKFLKEKKHTEIALAIHPNLFSQVMENPKKFNINKIINNLSLRKGTARDILLFRPLLIKVLLGLGIKDK